MKDNNSKITINCAREFIQKRLDEHCDKLKTSTFDHYDLCLKVKELKDLLGNLYYFNFSDSDLHD